ncbi:guanylate kinase [Rubrobacter calidifluminis]|uniref:guanylate kinase n=1 Tax=Rubrobacter calidifluminis TaxID=1392640 RepID=UPI002360C54F|nr:guanylate kinase [Rubrobacter calidifluminis]
MQGKLIVVSGPSGAGKDTLIKAALAEIPSLALVASATTRPPRPGEVDGRDHVFLSREEFERWIREGKLLEWAEYSGNLYGTPKESVERLLAEGRNVILRIELQGARAIKKKRPDAVMIFVRAPSLEETRRRLESRATETRESLESRMATAVKEVAAREEFDYEVVNGDREQASAAMIELLRKIVEGEDEDAG